MNGCCDRFSEGVGSSIVDSHSKVAEEGSDVLSPLVIALDDILHLERTKWER